MPREVAAAAHVIESFPDGHLRNRMMQYDVRPRFRHLLETAGDIVVDLIDEVGKSQARPDRPLPHAR